AMASIKSTMENPFSFLQLSIFYIPDILNCICTLLLHKQTCCSFAKRDCETDYRCAVCFSAPCPYKVCRASRMSTRLQMCYVPTHLIGLVHQSGACQRGDSVCSLSAALSQSLRGIPKRTCTLVAQCIQSHHVAHTRSHTQGPATRKGNAACK